MGKPNYKQIYAMKAERENRIKKICPGIPYSSGIYVFYRDDETGLHMAYCGQAVSLCERCASHLAEYDHIGLSLKKRGFYSEENPYGWKLTFMTCRKEDLDENERTAIKYYANQGYQLYNVSSGGQGKGRNMINETKPQRGYRDGVEQGKRMLAKELSNIVSKHLTIKIKEEKQGNKVSEKMLEKFKRLLSEESYKQ